MRTGLANTIRYFDRFSLTHYEKVLSAKKMKPDIPCERFANWLVYMQETNKYRK